MVIIQNPDIDKYNEVTEAVKKNEGYCPCMIFKTPDTRCMCKEFRDAYSSGKAGPCRCGRFIATEEMNDSEN